MKATELIKKIQNAVNNHGDFDVKIHFLDDENCVDIITNEDWNMDFFWCDESDGFSKQNQHYGGVICVDYLEDVEEENEE